MQQKRALPALELLSTTSAPRPLFTVPTARVFLLLIALWAAIYLPGLGSTELKGEEGRRILPAITMLETGNWVVPYVGGAPFLRKPPLVNWLIALSLKFTGSRSEWAARLPAVLSMLALAVVILALGTGHGWMNAETALVAALLVITPAAALDKGRLAEIDAIYLALSGIAIVVWLAFWTQRRSPWLLWLVPFALLGLGLLAKAPLHLLFFYLIVVCVLRHAGELRLLLHPAHFAGLALAAAIVAPWAILYFRDPATAEAARIWQGQSVGRVTGQFDWSGWITNLPRALLDQLPWLLFAPLLWRRALPSLGERPWQMFRGARLGVMLGFFGLLLVPGALPRYTLPLLAPFACLLAFALGDFRLPSPALALRCWWRGNTILAILLLPLAIAGPIALAMADRRHLLTVRPDLPADFAAYVSWSLLGSAAAMVIALAALLGRRRLARPVLLAATSTALLGAAMILYASAAVPFINRADKLRPIAYAIDETVPPGQTLCVYDPDFQPVLFYLRTPIVYAPIMERIPTAAQWVLTRQEKLKKLKRDRPEFEPIRQFPEGKPPQLILLQRRAP